MEAKCPVVDHFSATFTNLQPLDRRNAKNQITETSQKMSEKMDQYAQEIQKLKEMFESGYSSCQQLRQEGKELRKSIEAHLQDLEQIGQWFVNRRRKEKMDASNNTNNNDKNHNDSDDSDDSDESNDDDESEDEDLC